MKWIEIIELRNSDNFRKQLEKHIQEFVKQVEKKTEGIKINLYTRMMIDIKFFSIHLIHDSGKVKNEGSAPGIKLVSILKSFGLVNHTVWIEKQKDSST